MASRGRGALFDGILGLDYAEIASTKVARPGNKFILIFIFANGDKFVVSQHGDVLAFIPFVLLEKLPQVLAWDSIDEMNEWFTEFRKTKGERAFKALISLRMEIGQMLVAH